MRAPHNRRMNRFGLFFWRFRPRSWRWLAPRRRRTTPRRKRRAAEAPAADQPPPATEPPAPIYDEKLLRLSEILGSLSFLRDLCGESDGAAWRDEMSALLDGGKARRHSGARA